MPKRNLQVVNYNLIFVKENDKSKKNEISRAKRAKRATHGKDRKTLL
jgi:hypothetical protein